MRATTIALAVAIASLIGCAGELDNLINPNPDAPRTLTPDEVARNIAFTCTHTQLRHTAHCAKYDASPEGRAAAAKEKAAKEAALAQADEQRAAEAERRAASSANAAAALEAIRKADEATAKADKERAARAAAYAASPEGKAEAADLARRTEDGARIVRAYKVCMVAANSTREARRLQVYETSLYCEYIKRAADRCHAASQCDRLTDPEGCVYDGGITLIGNPCP
jgi:hypothetical protein